MHLRRSFCETEGIPPKIPKRQQSHLVDALVDQSGDVQLLGQDGSVHTAHSSILVESAPYFQALLSKNWSGENTKDLSLPVPATGETIKTFLKGLYGVPIGLQAQVGKNFPQLEDVYRLADACGARQICLQIVHCLEVSEANVSWWIDWLKEEHAPDEYEAVKKKVCSFMKSSFAPADLWDFFEPDTMQALWEVRQGDSRAQRALEKSRGKTKVAQ
ncbi:hypothetical protein KFL_001100250 [Klebsormidium nitens]|uniref:BTB domain-containing protein n=1 Tax=Klebsormidium nitens TaxID=105231 RepID=A0A1Y1HZQ6_KLENI|nr:hypothetical protein KFL_001100250 [Klebsormidium nitens]|eukprot:GAQ82411.1 hypothetical protein KFL_001100250 [Klebsormidium nitens]